MRKTKNMLWVLSLMLMCLSCYDDTELLNRIDALEKAQTSTVNNVDEQVKAIKSSIASLTDLQNSLKDQLTALESRYEALQMAGAEQDSRLSELEKDVMNLTNMVQQIAVMIDSLRSTVNDLLAEQKSWVEATFATIEQHNALCDVLATTKVSLEDMMKGYDEANVAKFAALAGQIQTVETSLKAWVSDQLANYYDIASMDAKLKALETAISEGDDAAKKEYEELTAQLATLEQSVAAGEEQAAKEHAELTAKLKALEEAMGKGDEALKKELASLAASAEAMKQELTTAYQSAIKTAIEENNGTITKQMAKEIAAVNDRMDKAVAELNARMTALETRVDALEKQMAELTKQLDIAFDETEGIVYSAGSTVKVGYTLVNADDNTTVEAIADGDWKAKVVSTSNSEGYIEVATSAEGGEGKVLVYVNKGNNTIMRALRFEQGELTVLKDVYNVPKDGGSLSIILRTNLDDYTINIPKKARVWLKTNDASTRSMMHDEEISLLVSPNNSSIPRSTIVELMDNGGHVLSSFVVMQSANPFINASFTIKDFIDCADEHTEYQLTGVVTSIVNTMYGNLYIEDETGSIYIYGLLTPEGEAKQFESLDVDVNDTLTVRGTYTLYNNIVEIKNATYVDNKKFPGTDPVEYATELINGGFEKWSAGKPEGWTSVASNATITPSADAFEGESAVAVAGIKSSNKRFTSEILRLQPNTGDEHYLFTVYAKAGSAVFSKIRPGHVTITDGKADTYTYADAAVEVTAEWTKYEYTFQLTEQTDVALIIMNARNDKGENMLLIDNASLKISKASTY